VVKEPTTPNDLTHGLRFIALLGGDMNQEVLMSQDTITKLITQRSVLEKCIAGIDFDLDAAEKQASAFHDQGNNLTAVRYFGIANGLAQAKTILIEADFKCWCDCLESLANIMDVHPALASAANRNAWRSYYDEGLAPHEALQRDLATHE
jgi:hypothetical protein